MSSLRSASPLPDPLPPPPNAPVSTLGKLRDRIDAPELPFQEQTTLVFELKSLLDSEDNAADARVLLTRLRQHPDLRANIEREISTILAASQPSVISAPARQDPIPQQPEPNKAEPKREKPAPPRSAAAIKEPRPSVSVASTT